VGADVGAVSAKGDNQVTIRRIHITVNFEFLLDSDFFTKIVSGLKESLNILGVLIMSVHHLFFEDLSVVVVHFEDFVFVLEVARVLVHNEDLLELFLLQGIEGALCFE